MAEISTRPYLIRALYEWCTANGYRPHIAVAVDERTQVPREFVRNGEIVLNISAAATNRLSIGNELLEFEARFGGVARQVSIPIDNVSAIFAQENGRGMAFEVPKAPAVPGEGPDVQPQGADAEAAGAPAAPDDAGEAGAAPAPARSGRRPKLAAVPASGEESPKPARRKPKISAVPAAPEPKADVPPQPAPDASAPGEHPDGGPGDDGPGPAGPGRPRLTRVK